MCLYKAAYSHSPSSGSVSLPLPTLLTHLVSLPLIELSFSAYVLQTEILAAPFFFFLALLGLRCFTQFSPAVGLLSSCSALAFNCSGFSCFGAWAVGKRASVVAVPGL